MDETLESDRIGKIVLEIIYQTLISRTYTQNIFKYVLLCSFPRPKGRRFGDEIFNFISSKDNVRTLMKTLMALLRMGSIDNNSALVQAMAFAGHGTSLYSNHCWSSLLGHICAAGHKCFKNSRVYPRHIHCSDIPAFVCYGLIRNIL